MNLQSQLDQEFTNLGSGGAATVAVGTPPRKLTCEVVERNPLAVSFDRIRLETSELAGATIFPPAGGTDSLLASDPIHAQTTSPPFRPPRV